MVACAPGQNPTHFTLRRDQCVFVAGWRQVLRLLNDVSGDIGPDIQADRDHDERCCAAGSALDHGAQSWIADTVVRHCRKQRGGDEHRYGNKPVEPGRRIGKHDSLGQQRIRNCWRTGSEMRQAPRHLSLESTPVDLWRHRDEWTGRFITYPSRSARCRNNPGTAPIPRLPHRRSGPRQQALR